MDEEKRAFLNVLFHPEPPLEDERIKLVRRSMARRRAQDGFLRLQINRLKNPAGKPSFRRYTWDEAWWALAWREANVEEGLLEVQEQDSLPAKVRAHQLSFSFDGEIKPKPKTQEPKGVALTFAPDQMFLPLRFSIPIREK